MNATDLDGPECTHYGMTAKDHSQNCKFCKKIYCFYCEGLDATTEMCYDCTNKQNKSLKTDIDGSTDHARTKSGTVL